MKSLFITLSYLFSLLIIIFTPLGTCLAQTPDQARIISLFQNAEKFSKQSNYQQALKYYDEAISLAAFVYGQKSPELGTLLYNQAGIYRKLANYPKAEAIYKRAVSMFEESKGPECQEVDKSLSSLGFVYYSQGDYIKAAAVTKRALAIREKTLGSEHPDLVELLNNLAVIYKLIGNYIEAEVSYKRVLAIMEKTLAPNHPMVLHNRSGLSELYFTLGQYEKSEKLIREILDIREKTLGPSHPDVAESLNNLASLQSTLGKYDQAEPLFKRALTIWEKALGPEHTSVANCLNNLSQVYSNTGEYSKAESLLKRALTIREKVLGLEHPDTATNLHNLAGIYQSLGKYEDALNFYDKALKIKKILNIPKSTATSLNNIATLYSEFGQYEKALTYHEEALKIRRELNIPVDIATSLNNIGSIYDILCQYKKAISYYEEALKTGREVNVPEITAGSLHNIGGVYSSLGQYEKALAYYNEAYKITRKLNMRGNMATIGKNIGTVYYSLNQYEEALAYYNEAYKIHKELNSPQDIARSLNNIGMVCLAQKNYEKSERSFLEAGKEYEKTGRKYNGNAGLVELYLATNRYEEALSLLKEMTPSWNTHDDYRMQFHTQHGLALKGKGSMREASTEFFKAISITEAIRQKVKEVKERTDFWGAHERMRSYRGLVATLSERAMKGEKIDKEFINYGKDLFSNAFYFSELTKARTLLEAMAESGIKSQQTELPEELRNKEQSILNQLSAIDNQWEGAYKKGKDVIKSLQDRKERLTSELNSLIKELSQNYPRYASLYYPKPIPPEELPLKEDEVLLEYVVADNAIYTFVVKKGGVKNLFKIPLGKGALEEKVKEFLEPMNTRNLSGFSIEKAKELYKLLLSEALKEVTYSHPTQGKDTKGRVIIIADGILGLLPFEALVIKEGTNVKDSLYVADEYTISYYQSATVLSFQRNLKGDQPDKILFALGNPVFSNEDPRYIAWSNKQKEPLHANINKYSFRGLAIKREWGKTTEADKTGNKIEFQPLPETEIEVKEIAKIMDVSPKPPDVLLSVLANESMLKNAGLNGYRYIHFATHASLPGMIQGVNEPFVLLSQVENKDKDDGFLTLSEVLDFRLNADMVVLSACVTGVGREIEGEGLANFARAFQHAGARSVVVSLWEVASDPTVKYMKTFYSYLKAGKSRIAALRLARNEMKIKYPNPFYWAVFILHGEG